MRFCKVSLKDSGCVTGECENFAKNSVFMSFAASLHA